MERKKKPNGLLISGLISALASLAIVAIAPGFAAGPSDKTKSESSQSKDNDGDHDNDPNTALEDDHTTSDDGDNAHPSGKDRSVENGKSGNQGKAESNPDDSKGPMRYEGGQGDDKPQGPGGSDTDDQDGNNGCGNDDDFDDDNNGWCGKPTKSSTPPSGGGGGGGKSGGGKSGGGDDVAGDNSKSDMTITVDCYSVSVSSSKDISFVEVTFADGTTVKVEGLSGYSYSNSFSKPLASGRAKSGTTIVSGTVSGDCDAATPPVTCPDGSSMPASGNIEDCEVQPILCPDGSEMPTGGNCGEGVPCPDGTEMNEDGNCDEVLGEHIERDENPALPEVEAAAEADAPSVLGIRLSPALNEPVKVAGAVLPFTGGDVLVFLVLALALFGSGLVIMKATKIRSNHG